MSTSALFGVANAFANSQNDSKTLLCIANPQHIIGSHQETTFVDVSWLSHYPQEQEVIMGMIFGTAIFNPKQLHCNCGMILGCSHALERLQNNSKQVEIIPKQEKYLDDERRKNYLILFDGLITILENKLQNHKGLDSLFGLFVLNFVVNDR